MSRIAIIGCCGSGKTTLALQLHKILHVPVIHLDHYYWKPGWQKASFDEFKIIHDTLCDTDRWIMEGIYTRTLTKRIQAANIIIFLDLPRYVYIWRVIKRIIVHYGKKSPGAPEQCVERFDWQFFTYLWTFNKTKRTHILKLLNECSQDKKIYV